MGQELGNNCLDLTNSGKRGLRLGMTKALRYAPLHPEMVLEQKNVSKELQKPPETDINAPPVSPSDSEAGPEKHESGSMSSELSELESTTSKKRGSQDGAGSRKKRRKLEQDEDASETEDDCMKSTVKSTTFYDNSLCNTHKAKSDHNGVDDSDELFPWASSSQSRINYSKSRPKVSDTPTGRSPESDMRTRKSVGLPSSQTNGFKPPSDAGLKALDRRKEEQKAAGASAFKKPQAITVPSPESSGPRRSGRHHRKSGRPPTPEQPFEHSKGRGTFKIPPPNGLAPKFRAPARGLEFAETLSSEAAEVVKNGLKGLGVDPASDLFNVSSSVPSAPSVIPDDPSESSAPSSPPTSADLEANRLDLDLPDSPTPMSKADIPKSSAHIAELCPACKAPVSEDLISAFQEQHALAMPDGRIPWNLQKVFCRIHITGTAWDTWKERRYPDINWNQLPRRIEQHETVLEGILVGKRQSHHRKALEEKVKSGRKLTFVRSLANSDEDGGCQTGYYGSKGAKVMMEHLIKTFSKLLRELNYSDKLISAGGGVSAFVQAVLVPELATALIKEDMGVNEEEAREIIKESAALGELVNEEEGDVVDAEEVERKRLRDAEERRLERAKRKEQERQKNSRDNMP